MPNYDAILILGGGVRERGELPPWSVARFDLALKRETGEPLVCLSAGTTHRPPPLEDGFPIPESIAGARYLMSRGIHPGQIRIENMSYDTVGNAYLTKLLHVDPAGWRRLLVITSEFHMRRTRAIFEWVFGFEPGRYQLEFEASPDTGMPPDVKRLRMQKEEDSLPNLNAVRKKIGNLRALHEWVFTDHQAYAATAKWRQDRSEDALVLESY